MNTPIPVTSKPGWNPTGSTYGSLGGGALATVILGVLASYGHPLDATTSAALATVCAGVAGYFLNGGRQ